MTVSRIGIAYFNNSVFGNCCYGSTDCGTFSDSGAANNRKAVSAANNSSIFLLLNHLEIIVSGYVISLHFTVFKVVVPELIESRIVLMQISKGVTVFFFQHKGVCDIQTVFILVIKEFMARCKMNLQ